MLSQVEDIFPFTPILRYRYHFFSLPHKKALFLFSPICLVSFPTLDSMCPVSPTPTHRRSPHLPTLDAGAFPVEQGSLGLQRNIRLLQPCSHSSRHSRLTPPWKDEAQTPSPILIQVSPLSTQLPPSPSQFPHMGSLAVWACKETTHPSQSPGTPLHSRHHSAKKRGSSVVLSGHDAFISRQICIS